MRTLRSPEGKSPVMERMGISQYCGPNKKRVIIEHWANRAEWARDGDYSFRILAEKVAGDLAAALIGAVSPDSPFGSEVIPLALVRNEGAWKVGPVEGSFENTPLGFDPEVTAQTESLERWMARERIEAASALLKTRWQKFRQAVGDAVPREKLQNAGPAEALAHFLSAAEAGNTDAILLWLGLLEREAFPEVDWENHLHVTRRGMKGEDQQGTWRLLTSGKVMRVILADELEEGESSQEILVGFLSAFEAGTINDHLNPVRFELNRTQAGWRVKLPIFFSFADEDRDAFRTARNRAMEWRDRDGVRRMFQLFEKEHPRIRNAGAQAMVEETAEDLQKGDLETYLRRLYRYTEKKAEEDGGEDGQEAEEQEQRLRRLQQRRLGRGGNDEADEQRQKIYEAAVKWWDLLHDDRETTRVELSKLIVKDEIALAILSLPSSPDSWEPRYLKLWLGRGAEGWMILPGHEEPLEMTYPESQEKVVSELSRQFEDHCETANERFLAKVFEVVALGADEGKAATEEEAYRVVREWRQIAQNGGMMDLLKASALREIPEDSGDLLTNLGYVRKDAAGDNAPDQYLGSRASGRYRAVSLMIDPAVGSIRKCPLLIVVPTKEGYRVLVDIELPLATNRGASLRNEVVLEELAEEMPEEDFERIKELQKWHQETAGPVWEKWDRQKHAQNN